MPNSCNVDNANEFDLVEDPKFVASNIHNTKNSNRKRSISHNLYNIAEESREYNTRLTLATLTINLTRTLNQPDVMLGRWKSLPLDSLSLTWRDVSLRAGHLPHLRLPTGRQAFDDSRRH